MTMPSWPSSLPAMPLIDRFREDAPSTAIRTEMDQGPAKVRRRTTADVSILELGYLLSRVDVATLDAFYAGDCAGGSLVFSFMHPRMKMMLDCRFRVPPAYASTNGEYYHAAIELEVLP